MEIENKKALLELIKECDDVEYLRQMAKTAEAIADAIENFKKAKTIMNLVEGNKTKLSFTSKSEGREYVPKINIDDVPGHNFNDKDSPGYTPLKI